MVATAVTLTTTSPPFCVGRQAAACTVGAVFSLARSTYSADTVKALPVNIKLAIAQTRYHTQRTRTHKGTTAECFTMIACHLDYSGWFGGGNETNCCCVIQAVTGESEERDGDLSQWLSV